EYWAATCATGRDKVSGRDVPLMLNGGQRRIVEVLERQRRAGEPIRAIVLKARQMGGSTLVQLYMAWVQLELKKNWNVLVCAHKKDTARGIRNIYDKLLGCYPGNGNGRLCMTGFEGSDNTKQIKERGCRITLASSERYDTLRGGDYAMAQMSEVAFWNDSRERRPAAFVQAIAGSVLHEPLTMLVMESTANGVGNFFHTEWLRAKAGSDKEPVFVPWYDVEIYSRKVVDHMRLWSELDAYELWLWNDVGLTLEQINWYHSKRKEMSDHAQMKGEFPTTDTEAFNHTGNSVFTNEWVERLRSGCREPQLRGEVEGATLAGAGALTGVKFVEDARGGMEVWELPCRADENMGSASYVVAVDVGGRSDDSDYSVIAVMDRRMLATGGKPRIVAQWRGHTDHDLLAWKAAAIATWYNNALLVIESNTLETEAGYLLAMLADHYGNLYTRQAMDENDMPARRVGFHTNVRTKRMMIATLIAKVRGGDYEERSAVACDEMVTYRQMANGGYGASRGKHDDVLMTRAMLLQVSDLEDAPRRQTTGLHDLCTDCTVW
ncbi:MAG: hypothetical protein K2M76_02765, partial [Muribaculaceae bacterium]|nr:hypothetical protein [Muribaculaceae bacterium]